MLTMPTSLRYVGHLFSVGKATTREDILEVCGTLQNMLGHTVLQFHDTLELVVGFQALGFPQCIRSLNETHMFVTCLLHRDRPY